MVFIEKINSCIFCHCEEYAKADDEAISTNTRR